MLYFHWSDSYAYVLFFLFSFANTSKSRIAAFCGKTLRQIYPSQMCMILVQSAVNTCFRHQTCLKHTAQVAKPSQDGRVIMWDYISWPKVISTNTKQITQRTMIYIQAIILGYNIHLISENMACLHFVECWSLV